MNFNISDHPDADMLNAWVDNAVSNDERRDVGAHLESCAACQSEVDSLLLVKQLLSALPDPALPRSFQLTPEIAHTREPIAEPILPSAVVRLLPIVRILSIAAVLAVLILGGATAFGPVSDALSDDEPNLTTEFVTNRAVGASRDANPASLAKAPGEVIDQGEAATSTDSAMRAIGSGVPQVEISTADERSLLEIATISTGILAVSMVGLWVLLEKLSRTHPAHRDSSPSAPGDG